MIEVLPPAQMKETILRIARDSGMPGCGDHSLIDARPYMRTIVDELYKQGYALVVLQDSPVVQKIATKLNSGESAKLNA